MILAQWRRHPSFPLCRIAVLCRSRLDLSRIAAALEIQRIPFVSRERRSAADDPGVQDVLAWVELLSSPTATWAARRAAHAPALPARY